MHAIRYVGRSAAQAALGLMVLGLAFEASQLWQMRKRKPQIIMGRRCYDPRVESNGRVAEEEGSVIIGIDLASRTVWATIVLYDGAALQA